MALGLSIFLNGFGVVAFMLGFTLILGEKRADKFNLLFFGICCSSMIWCLSYSVQLMVPLERVGYLTRYFALLGILSYLVFAEYLIIEWTGNKSPIAKRLANIMLIFGILIYPVISSVKAVYFAESRWGYTYGYNVYAGRWIYDVVLLYFFFSSVGMMLWGKKHGKTRQEKANSTTLLFCAVILTSGTLFDTILPTWFGLVFPGSAFMQFFSIIIMYVISIRRSVSRLSLSNIAEFMFESQSAPLLVLDNQGFVIRSNESASRFFGVEKEKLEQSAFYTLFQMESSKKMLECEVMDGKCILNGKYCQLNFSHVFNRYRDYMGEIVLISDLTEKMTMIQSLEASREEAVDANRAKSAFLANMSHEIRTPLNAIIGFSNILQQRELDRESKEDVQNIVNAGQGLLSIVNDVLDLSKIEAGKYTIFEEAYNIKNLVMDICGIMAEQIHDKGLQFLLEVQPDLNLSYYGDSVRIKQILINMLGNAAKYTTSGFVKFSVSAKELSGEKQQLIFQVEDSGIGIKAEDIPNIFGTFTQVDEKKNRSVEGTGLGLSISQKLAQLMGGNIEVSSVYEKGTIFTLKIPQRMGERILVVGNAQRKEKMFLFEPNLLLRESLEKALQGAGVSFHSSDTLEEICQDDTCIMLRDDFINQYHRLKPMMKVECRVLVLGTSRNRSDLPAKEMTRISLPVCCMKIADFLNKSGTEEKKQEERIVSGKAVGKSILVIDDNEMNCKVVVGLLAKYHLQIDVASSGREGAEKTKQKHYDMILLDQMMPDMDGAKTMLEIKGQDNFDGEKTAIIAFTANTIGNMKEHYMQLGYTDYLAKPIELGSLHEMLLKYVFKEETHEENHELSENAGNSVLWQNQYKGIGVGDALDKLNGDIELYGELLDVYRDNVIHLKEKAAKALEEAATNTFAVHAHAMKSASATVGAMRLSELSKQMEYAGKADDLSQINEKLKPWYDEMDNTLLMIEELSQKIKGTKSLQ